MGGDGDAALRPGSLFLDRARAILAAERVRLSEVLPHPDVTLVGGSSIPTALTRGDVDLHLRVPPGAFAATVSVLAAIHPVVHEDIWQPTLATFSVAAALPTGLAVTPIGSAHDLRFRRSWQLLAADPELVAAYNAMKVRHLGGGVAEYEQHKSGFFDLLERLWADHPAGGAGRAV